jgi:hypothetical protein
MSKPLTFAALILVLTACSPTPTTVPEPAAASPNEPAVIPASPVPTSNTTITDIQPAPASTSATEATGPLWLQVLSPPDETVVNVPQVEVIGSAPAGAVVSVNDEIILVGENGQFNAIAFLEEGINLIEIIASDASGNETSLLLTVIYEP